MGDTFLHYDVPIQSHRRFLNCWGLTLLLVLRHIIGDQFVDFSNYHLFLKRQAIIFYNTLSVDSYHMRDACKLELCRGLPFFVKQPERGAFSVFSEDSFFHELFILPDIDKKEFNAFLPVPGDYFVKYSFKLFAVMAPGGCKIYYCCSAFYSVMDFCPFAFKRFQLKIYQLLSDLYRASGVSPFKIQSSENG